MAKPTPENTNAAPATETEAVTTTEKTAPGAQDNPTSERVSSETKPLDLSGISIAQQPGPQSTNEPPGGESDKQRGEPHASVGGIDVEKKRRGRPPISDAEKKAKAEARAAAEKSGARTAKTTQAAPTEQAARQLSPDALSGAALIMQSLDFVRTVISNGEVDKDLTNDEAQQRAIIRQNTSTAWATYLDDCGAKLPPWAVVTVLSAVYVAPALRTPTAREKLGFAWLKVKEWVKKKWNKHE